MSTHEPGNEGGEAAGKALRRNGPQHGNGAGASESDDECVVLVQGREMLDDEHNLLYFSGLQVADASERSDALTGIIEELKEAAQSRNGDDVTFARKHVGRVLMLSQMCPFEDVRVGLSGLLNFLETDLGWLIPPREIPVSMFYSDTPRMEGEVADLLAEHYLPSGRTTHLDLVLTWHPTYLSAQLDVLNVIMRGPGALAPEWRFYIALMAASVHSCHYLIHILREDFVMLGGELQWLEGIEHAPEKLARLSRLNVYLAFRPWRITKGFIAELTDHAEGSAASWAVGEVVHAILILCSYHSLSSLVWASGISPELDDIGTEAAELLCTTAARTRALKEAYDQRMSGMDDAESERLFDKLQQREEEMAADSDGGASSGAGEKTAEERMEEFANDEEDDPSDEATSTASTSTAGGSDAYSSRSNLLRETTTEFMLPEHAEIRHRDFEMRMHREHSDYNLLGAHDFAWPEHGFGLVSRYYPEAAAPLDHLFRHTYAMTDGTFNGQKASTLPFRRAVWYYAQRVKGVFHTDYDYSEPNKFLLIPLKKFIKKVVTVPDKITNADVVFGFRLKLSDRERVHVTALAVESLRQVEVLYGLHAVMEHMMPS